MPVRSVGATARVSTRAGAGVRRGTCWRVKKARTVRRAGKAAMFPDIDIFLHIYCLFMLEGTHSARNWLSLTSHADIRVCLPPSLPFCVEGHTYKAHTCHPAPSTMAHMQWHAQCKKKKMLGRVAGRRHT